MLEDDLGNTRQSQNQLGLLHLHFLPAAVQDDKFKISTGSHLFKNLKYR